MANNAQYDVIVNVITGHLEKATKELRAMGGAVDSVNTSQTKATKGSAEHTRALGTGAAAATNSTREFTKLRDTIGNGSSGIVGAYATLAINAYAVGAAFTALNTAAKAEQLLRGLEEQGARTGQTLTITAKSMREITGDAISMADAMQSAAQMTAAGFSTTTMERLTRVASDAAAALGRSLPDAMDRVVKGTTKLEPELLDELGIMTKLDEATRLYATELGKAPASLTRFEKQQAFVNAVAAEGERKFAGLSNSVGDLKAYDSLGAAFTDLTNSGLGLLNGLLLPVANFLSNNTGVLIGVLVLFAGTIRAQLLPAFSEMAERSGKAAAASRELAKVKKEEIITITETAKKIANEAAVNARSFAIHQKAPKLFKDSAAAIKAGSTASQDFEVATKSLNRSIKTYEDNITNGKYADEAAIASKRELISELKAQKAIIERVAAADKAASADQLANALSVDLAKKKAIKADIAATKQEGLARVVKVASEGDTLGAFDTLNTAVADYKTKLEEASGSGGLKGMFSTLKTGAASAMGSFKGITTSIRTSSSATVGLRVGLTAVAGAARVAGIAFTNMIPVIGQIITVAGLLWSAVSWLWEWTKPEGVEALNKALEDQEERYNTTAAAAQNLKRVGMDSAEAQVQSLTAVSNKVNELIDGYTAIKEAEANVGRKLGEDESKEIKSPLQNLKLDSSITDSESYKALENMTKLGFDTLNEKIYSSIRGIKALADESVSLADKQKILEVVLKDIGKAFGDAGSNSTALKEGYVSLDKSVEEFNRTAITSTPFDNIVRDLTTTAASVYNLEASMYKGAISAKDYGIQLSGIGDRAAGLLDADVQSKLEVYKSAVAEVTNLNTKIAKGVADPGDAQKVVELNKTIASSTEEIGAKIRDNLIAKQQELSLLQNQLRTNASLIAVEKARYEKAARALEDTKLSARLQDESTEAQVRMAVETLNAQIKYTTNMKKRIDDQKKAVEEELARLKRTAIEQEKNQKASIKIQEEATKKQLLGVKALKQVYAGILESIVLGQFYMGIGVDHLTDKLNKGYEATKRFISGLAENSALANLFEDVKDTDIKVSIDTQAADNALNNTKAQIASLEGSLLSLTEQSNGFSSQLTSLNSSKFVELAKILSSAEKSARDLKYDTQLLNEYTQTYVKIAESLASLDLERAKANKNIINSFGQQLLVRQKQLDIEINSIKAQKEQERNTLKAQQKGKEMYLAQKDLSIGVRNAANFDLNVIKARLAAIDTEIIVSTNVAKVKAALVTIEEASIDVYKEGLEIQQRALEVIQKRFDLQSKLLDQTSELNTLRAETRAAETGIPMSDRAKKSLELQTAEEVYQLALSQLDLKLKGINLEYALLEAQRIALVFEFEGRAKLLEAEKLARLQEATSKAKTPEEVNAAKARADEIGVMLDQFNSTTSDLRRQSYKDLVPMAEQIERRSVEILGQRAAKIRAEFENMGQPTTSANVLMQAVNDFFTINKAKTLSNRDGMGTGLSATVIADAEKAAKAQQTETEKLIESIDTRFPDLTVELQNLQKVFTSLVGSLSDKLKVPLLVKTSTTMSSIAGAASSPVGANDDEEISVTAGRLPTAFMESSSLLKTDLIDMRGLIQNVDLELSKTSVSFGEYWNFAIAAAQPLLKTLRTLGPSGEASAAAIEGIQQIGSVAIAFSKTAKLSLTEINAGEIKNLREQAEAQGIIFDETTAKITTKAQFRAQQMASAFSAAAAIVGTMSSILKASSDAKIASIDKEIAAEEKRDGKSAASVEKLKALDAKKEASARKAFNVNKKLMLAQAVMSTAAAIAMTLGQGGMFAIPIAALIGAMGLAQVAVIAGTSYESTSAPRAAAMPSNLSIGKRSDTVDLAQGPNANAGGESAYLRGSEGSGSNASNYRTVGSAYGGELMRGYGNRGFVVGEKGPEVITPDTPISVTPANDTQAGQAMNATINIQALDSSDVQRVLVEQKGNIIQMLRQAANASGKTFMEDVNTNVYTRPNVGKL